MTGAARRGLRLLPKLRPQIFLYGTKVRLNNLPIFDINLFRKTVRVRNLLFILVDFAELINDSALFPSVLKQIGSDGLVDVVRNLLLRDAHSLLFTHFLLFYRIDQFISWDIRLPFLANMSTFLGYGCFFVGRVEIRIYRVIACQGAQ